jgi:alkylation response protein AidB-like acyl-CoA dehydrogenase
MDFSLDEETKLFRDAYVQWVERDLLPLEEKEKITQQAVELGVWGHHMPEDVGGGGLSNVASVILREACGETGSVLGSLAIAGPEGPSPMHLVFNEAQRKKYLDPVMEADQTCCFMLSEPGAGSDAQNIQTRAEKTGDKWVLEASQRRNLGVHRREGAVQGRAPA